MISIPSNLGFGDRLPSFGLNQSFGLGAASSQPHHEVAPLASYAQQNPAVPGTSAQPDNQVSSSNPSNPASPEMQELNGMIAQQQQQIIPQQQQIVHQQQQQPQTDFTIATWLNNLQLSAYVDNFHQQNLFNMFELQEFTLEDLQKMKIGTTHRNKIWRSLVEFRNSNSFAASQTELQRSGSNASTVSMQSNTGYCPGYYEVTRYTFKHTISLKKDDHDYCGPQPKEKQ